MPRYVLFNKPFRVLTQFTDTQDRVTLADYIDIPEIYSAGRLDYDSEGLLLLTDDGPLIHSMMNPRFKTPKTYCVQVEGRVTDAAITQLQKGLILKDGATRPAKARKIPPPDWLWERRPPIRERVNIPTSWLEITLTEGRNRQVRRMTAAVGFPTLRLIRKQLADLSVVNMEIGSYREVERQIIVDNGINWQDKKSGTPAASSRNSNARRSGQRPPRNQRLRSRNRKA